MVSRFRTTLLSLLCALTLGALALVAVAPPAVAEEAGIVTFDDRTQMDDPNAPDPADRGSDSKVSTLSVGKGVIALDPGHGRHGSPTAGYDGAPGVGGLMEDDCNWKISMYTKERLEQLGVSVYVTRSEFECPGLYERVERAVDHGAIAFICQHNNSYEDPSAHGFEIYVPNGTSDFNPDTHVEGRSFAERLVPKIEALGLYNRGIKERFYPGSATDDYYAVIRYAREFDVPGVLIEHAFVTNPEEARLLQDEDFLRRLGYADAEAIYEQWGDRATDAPETDTPVVPGDPGETEIPGIRVSKPTFVEPTLEERFEVAPENSVYRLSNPYSGEHLNTVDRNEVKVAVGNGWDYEGVKWVAPETGAPVYRLYNPYSHEHFYTMDANEYAELPSYGWRQEGMAFRSSDDSNGMPVYRLFNPYVTVGTHLFTTDPNEVDTLVREEGWQREGTLCRGIDPDDYIEPAGATPIMGLSRTTLPELKYYFADMMYRYGKLYPGMYPAKGAATPQDFVQILWEEATVEGVRPDVLLAQVIDETGWLQFGGDVKASQCNFGGIGATGNGNPGNSFTDVREGLRAQAQHLKAYASKEPLVNDCVDPRFNLVQRGCAPTVQELSMKWAMTESYGEDLVRLVNQMHDYHV